MLDLVMLFTIVVHVNVSIEHVMILNVSNCHIVSVLHDAVIQVFFEHFLNYIQLQQVLSVLFQR